MQQKFSSLLLKVAPFVQKSFYKKKGRKWKYNKHTAKSIALWFLLL